jgi:hypothetical protein
MCLFSAMEDTLHLISLTFGIKFLCTNIFTLDVMISNARSKNISFRSTGTKYSMVRFVSRFINRD